MSVFKESDLILEKASKLLINSGVICVMAETVYGLLGNAEDPVAIRRIFKIKERPFLNPLIVHVNSIEMAKELAFFSSDAKKIVKEFWPGPLTLILKKKKSNICSHVTAGLDTIAVRFPDSDIFKKIISRVNKPIAAPSANKSGYASSTKPIHVSSYFKNELDLIIDSGQSKYGIESTVINLSSEPYKILREGVINKGLLEGILNKKIKKNLKKGEILSPGQLAKHYSTKTPIRMNAKKPMKNEAFLGFGKVLSYNKENLNLSKNSNLSEAAFNLFDYLIKLDNLKKKKIAISPIPNRGLGKVINDKLKRASKYE